MYSEITVDAIMEDVRTSGVTSIARSWRGYAFEPQYGKEQQVWQKAPDLTLINQAYQNGFAEGFTQGFQSGRNAERSGE